MAAAASSSSSPCGKPFALWLKRNGVRWDGLKIVEAAAGSIRGAHVVATQDFDNGDILASIPKAAVLSIQCGRMRRFIGAAL